MYVFKTNFINFEPAPHAPGFSLASAFELAIQSSQTQEDKNFGMQKKFLLPEQNQKIIDALAELGVKNVTREDLFYFDEKLPDAYLDECSNSPSANDREFAYNYRRGLYRNSTHKNEFEKNKRIFSWVDKDYLHEAELVYGFPEDFPLSVIAHEVSHRPTYNLFYGVDMAAGELVADYIGMEVAGPEYFLIMNFCKRGNQYSYSQQAAYDAFKEVLGTIDEKLVKKVFENPEENPLEIANEKFQALDQQRVRDRTFKIENIPANEKVNFLFRDALYQCYEKHVKGLEMAPASFKDFMSRIANQFKANVSDKAHALMKERLAANKAG